MAHKIHIRELLVIGIYILGMLGVVACGGGGGSAVTLSNNAQLSDIQLSVGQLDQVFQTSQTAYTGAVDYLASSIQITASSEDANASLTIGGIATASGAASNSFELAEGDNSIIISVTAEDGSSTLSYSLNITRQGVQAFAQQAYIKASNTDANDRFGFSLALSGDTLAVGAALEASAATGINGNPADNTTGGSGAVYVFTRTGGVWSQQAYVKASNTNAGDLFGFSLALSGDTLAVGAREESSAATGINGNQVDNTALNSGAVYAFR